MRKVQEGQLNIEIPEDGHDEISELASHFRKMMSKVNELISVVVRKEIVNKEAEIKALMSQINRHFIYNVLEAINMMAEINNQEEIADIVTSLGRMMRYSMDWKKQYVTLGEELDNIKNFISLTNVRFFREVNLRIDINERFLIHEIPKMSLQPIVENAVSHGLEGRGEGGLICISVYVHKCNLIIEIEDNGIGMSSDELISLNESIHPEVVEKNLTIYLSGI